MAEKTARKKTTKKTAKKTARKRTTKKVAAKSAVATKKTSTTMPTRKAPTKIAANSADKKYSRNVLVLSSLLFLVFVGISVAVGFSGDGEIEVSKEYERRLAVATDEERAAIEKAANPPQPKNNLPMGGLIGAKTGGTKPQPAPTSQPVTSSSTASTTDAALAASSTEASGIVAGESTDQSNEVVDKVESTSELSTDTESTDTTELEGTTESVPAA